MSRKRTSVIQVMITGDAKDLNRATQSGSKGIGLLGAAAITAAKVVTTAVSAIAGFSIREFAKFDDAMVKSTAIMGDLSDTMRKDMSDAARQVALTTTFAADEAAEAFFFLASAGLTAEQSIAALPQVARFAQAGAFDLALATDLLTDAQSALGMTSQDTTEHLAQMARISDVLVKANTLANASVEQFSAALTNKAGAALRIMNKEVEEGVAALALLADRGVKGTEAGEKLSIMLRDVTRAAARSPAEFKRLGLQILDTDGNLRNIADVTEEFTRVLGGMSDAQAATTLESLGLTRSVGDVIRTMFGGADQIRAYEAALLAAGGATDEVAGKQLQSFTAQVSLLKSAFADVGITIGEALAGPLGEFVSFMQSRMPGIKKFFEDEFTPAFEEFVEKATIKFRAYKAAFDENLRQPLMNFASNVRSALNTAYLEFLVFKSRFKGFAGDFAEALANEDPEAAGEELGKFIAATFRQAFARAQEIGQIITDALGDQPWQTIGEAVGQQAVPFIKGFFIGLFAKPDDWLDEYRQGIFDRDIKTIASMFRDDFFSTLIGVIVASKIPILRTFVKPITAPIMGVIRLIASRIAPVGGSVLLGGFVALFRGVFAALRVVLTVLGAGFATFIATPLANALRTVMSLLGVVSTAEALKSAEAIRSFFRSTFATVIRSGFFTAIQQFVRVVVPRIAAAAVSIAAGFFGWPVVLAAAAIAALTVFIVRFRNWFKAQEGEFENIGSAVVTFIVQGFQKLAAWFTDTFIRWFGDRWTDIKTWIGTFAGQFAEVGIAIVNGIINGIKGAGSRLFSSLRDLARNALAAARGELDIKSPSREFARVGDEIAMGLKLGVDRSGFEATGAVSDLARQVAGVNFSAPTVPAGPRQGGGDIYITVNGALDSEGVARQIERVLRDSRRRTGGVLV
jgi:TP901 family phage tail tape measure protein